MPLTREEVTTILAACDDYPDKRNAVRLRALVLLLRYSGLRIGDAVTLPRDRITDGNCSSTRQNQGQPFTVHFRRSSRRPLKRYQRWENILLDWQIENRERDRGLAAISEATLRSRGSASGACASFQGHFSVELLRRQCQSNVFRSC
jgi:integrase